MDADAPGEEGASPRGTAAAEEEPSISVSVPPTATTARGGGTAAVASGFGHLPVSTSAPRPSADGSNGINNNNGGSGGSRGGSAGSRGVVEGTGRERPRRGVSGGPGAGGPTTPREPTDTTTTNTAGEESVNEEEETEGLPRRLWAVTSGAVARWLREMGERWNPRRNTVALWPTAEDRAKRLPVLDGVRTIAIGWVLLAAAFTSTFSAVTVFTYPTVAQYALNSDLAMDLLLLVSGVCITSVVLAEVEDTVDFNALRFLWRRLLALWPALAFALALNVVVTPAMRDPCRQDWWKILLFVNNYLGDQQCMPQTWLTAVLFQLYVLTPVLIFACVNYQAVSIRRQMSGYILLVFLSICSVVTAWVLYTYFDSQFTYEPVGWPPGPYFQSVFLRWSPYLSGMTIALMLWDDSTPWVKSQSERQRRAEGMPGHEDIQDLQPISCESATLGVLDLLADSICFIIMMAITVMGTQQDSAYISVLLRATYGWMAARLLYRLLSGNHKLVAGILSLPAGFTASQLAYPSFVLQSIIFIDIKTVLLLDPSAVFVFGLNLVLLAFSWLLYLLALAGGGYAVYLLVHKPILRMRPPRHRLSVLLDNDDNNRSDTSSSISEHGEPSEGKKEPPPMPLQRIRSQEDAESIAAFGSSQIIAETQITVRSGTQSSLRLFRDAPIPQNTTSYFEGSVQYPEDIPGSYWVFSVVTAYNEGGEEMADTLASMWQQVEHLPGNVGVHVLLVFDGWAKLSSSMRRLYPGDEEEQLEALEHNKRHSRDRYTPRWMQEVDETMEASWYRELMPVTYSLQQLNTEGHIVPVDIAPGKTMTISAIIKFDNRRKHNSHEWYLRAFAKQYPSKYLYLTDVGTTGDRHCIPRLVQYMEKNVDVCAATGFQRVQKVKQGATFVQHLQREVQAYELGAGNCHIVKASQGLMGFQAIICGPCQIVRTSDVLNEDFLDTFFEMINADPAEAGILHANMQQTEDMLFGCFLYSASPNKRTAYVPDAYFDYDVETAPDRFLKQRRRWTNGIVSGLHSLLNPCSSMWGKTEKPRGLRISTFIVMCHQYLMVMQFLILPSIYMYNIFYALGGYTVPTEEAVAITFGSLVTQLAPYLAVAAYVAAMAVWVFAHNRHEYIGWMYHTALVINMIIGVGTIVVMVWLSTEVSLTGSPQAVFSIYLVVMGLGGPVISSIVLGDSYGLTVGVVNAVFMLSFMPMWVMLGAYGLARFADFTWGNRPHESESQDGARRDAYMQTTKTVGVLILLMYLVGNAFLGVFFITAGFLWKGMGSLLFLILAVPYAFSGTLGLIYNIQFAVRNRWLPSLRRLLWPQKRDGNSPVGDQQAVIVQEGASA